MQRSGVAFFEILILKNKTNENGATKVGWLAKIIQNAKCCTSQFSLLFLAFKSNMFRRI